MEKYFANLEENKSTTMTVYKNGNPVKKKVLIKDYNPKTNYVLFVDLEDGKLKDTYITDNICDNNPIREVSTARYIFKNHKLKIMLAAGMLSFVAYQEACQNTSASEIDALSKAGTYVSEDLEDSVLNEFIESKDNDLTDLESIELVTNHNITDKALDIYENIKNFEIVNGYEELIPLLVVSNVSNVNLTVLEELYSEGLLQTNNATLNLIEARQMVNKIINHNLVVYRRGNIDDTIELNNFIINREKDKEIVSEKENMIQRFHLVNSEANEKQILNELIYFINSDEEKSFSSLSYGSQFLFRYAMLKTAVKRDALTEEQKQFIVDFVNENKEVLDTLVDVVGLTNNVNRLK